MSTTSTVDHLAVTDDIASSQQDFWLLYPSATGNGGLAGTLHALYYLPANYKLVVLSNAFSRDFIAMSEDSLIDRVRFENSAGLSNGTSPFSYADAVIYDGSADDAAQTKTPAVVISEAADKDIESNSRNGFTVSAGNPEALATAVLRIARAAA